MHMHALSNAFASNSNWLYILQAVVSECLLRWHGKNFLIQF